MRAPAPTARVDSRARFTVRGWCFLVAAVLCLAAATWLGRKDVLALSLFLGAVPLLSALAMWLVTPRVLLKRSVDPPLVPLGDAAQVALRVRRHPAFGRARPAGATSAERAAVDVHETVDPLLGRDQDVSVPVSGVPVVYTVRPRRRGIHELGPATVRVSDPFGVVTELLDVAEHTSLHVAPDPQELSEQGVVVDREGGGDPSRRAQPQPGADNVSTREYRHGDPMRRVHWAASARHDRLMVRQEDPRSTRRTVLVLDGVDQHWPGERVWAGVLASTHEHEWAVGAAASVVEHLTRRETVVYALDDQGRALPRGHAEPAELRDTAVGDTAATEVLHGLARVALTPRPEPEVASDPLTARLEREGLFHPVLLLTGALPAAAARRYVQAFAGSASCAVVMVVHAPLTRPEAADVFEAAGWTVVLVSRWTDLDAAWLAVPTGGSLMAPPPPEPGSPQLSMDDIMGRARRRTTA